MDSTEKSGQTFSSLLEDDGNEEEELAQKLRKELEIKDRKWRTKTYKQCFSHSDAIKWMMEHKSVEEEAAVNTLNKIRLAGYIQHVVDPRKPFQVGQQKTLYFSFLEDRKSTPQKTQERQLASKNYFKQSKKLTPEIFTDFLHDTPEFQAMETKLNRMEAALNQMEESQVSTITKLEIVHQCTISLIHDIIGIAALLVLIIFFILYAIVPTLNQSRETMLITSLSGMFLIGVMIKNGLSLFSIWLQLDTCVIQAAEGEEAVEDYEVTGLTVAKRSEDTTRPVGLPGSAAIRPGKPVNLPDRRPSLLLKEPMLTNSFSRSMTLKTPVQQRLSSDLPHLSTWPNQPVLVCANTPVDASLKVHKYGNGPCPIGIPFEFSTDLFEGKCLVRLKDVPNSDAPEDDKIYFAGRRRLFQTLVQGRFKVPLPVSDVLTGHEFVKPLKNLPHPWIINAATNFIKKLAPGAEIQVSGNQPTMLASLAATSQVVRGDEPGNEPDLASSANQDILEDCSLLGGKFAKQRVSSLGRKLHLASPQRASKYTFDTETVYTFDFYQSLLDVKTYSLDLGLANIGMSSILNGQPIQSLCKTTGGKYLWSFQFWHESLLQVSNNYGGGDDDKSRKVKSN